MGTLKFSDRVMCGRATLEALRRAQNEPTMILRDNESNLRVACLPQALQVQLRGPTGTILLLGRARSEMVREHARARARAALPSPP